MCYRQVPWNKFLLDAFVNEAMLTDDEIIIMQHRIKKIPQNVTADTLGISVQTLNRRVKELKRKYDRAAKNSDILPMRRN